MIVFDVETGPLPWGLLKDRIPPFDEVAAVPDAKPFDPGSVALGNLKDPAKIAAKVADARAAHELACETIPQRRAEARNQHVARHTEKAALSATTGMVKAIGMLDDDCEPEIHCVLPGYASEADVLTRFWNAWRNGAASGSRTRSVVTFCGHNIFGFDLPFLVRRSWMLGVDVPRSVRNGRYWAPQFVDLMDAWGLGQREPISLDSLDKVLGGDGKAAGCTGADFARLFDAGGADRDAAIAYLRHDLAMTRRIAEAIGVL